MTIPTKTIDILLNQIGQAMIAPAHDAHVVLGDDLNHLKALAMRLDRPEAMGADERRDWANWLNNAIDQALESPL